MESTPSTDNKPVAILYQAAPPPEQNGIQKPMKPGGYADSGADIAYALRQKGVFVITPIKDPDPSNALDWVFPDTTDGIQQAMALGANILWLNTILFEAHPIQQFLNKGLMVVGQDPDLTGKFDDKWDTNQILKSYGLPIPAAALVSWQQQYNPLPELKFPLIAKPIRGRGSAGVTLVEHVDQLAAILKAMLGSGLYGNAIMLEEYLPGQEVTITVMPPGFYIINGQTVEKDNYWGLPPVRRYNHQNGVAPYNGLVAVVNNSEVLSPQELKSPAITALIQQCEVAARIVKAKAPVRIDCRQDNLGNYFLFDLNMKPNMTGAGRPGRSMQDSLSALAARSIGWDYQDLLINILGQSWTKAL